jgi:hypothetical protein
MDLGNAPTLEQPGQGHAAGAGGIAEAAGGQHRLAQLVFGFDGGPWRTLAHRDGHRGGHPVHPAAGHHMPRSCQPVDRVLRQHDDIERLPGLDPPGRVHAPDRLDLDRNARTRLVGLGQFGQHQTGGHGRDAAKRERHA